MNSIPFENWKSDHDKLYGKYIFKTEGEDCRWGRLLCTWHEKGKSSALLREHHVYYCIDLRNGDLYVDDSKTVIFFKSLGVIPLRVAQVFFKTIFHLLLPISLPMIIFKTIQQEMKKYNEDEHAGRRPSIANIGWKCLENSAASIGNIIRTPFYGVAMTCASLLAVILSPFDPVCLYDFRKLAGEYEDKMFEWDIVNWGIYTECFHPFNTIEKVYKQVRKQHNEDTDYSKCKSQFEINLSNMARTTVLIRIASS